MRLLKQEKGATLAEYAIIVAMIALVAVMGVKAKGGSVARIYCSIPIIMEYYEWIDNECVQTETGGDFTNPL